MKSIQNYPSPFRSPPGRRAVFPLLHGLLSLVALWGCWFNLELRAAAPVVLPVPDQFTWEEEPIENVRLTVWDAETPASELRFITSLVFTNTPDLRDTNGLVVEGTGTNRWLSIFPPQDATGTGLASVSVQDGSGLVTTVRFAVSVQPVNDPPAFAGLPSQEAVTGEGPWSVLVRLSDVDSPASAIRVRARSSRPSVVADGSLLILAGSDSWSRRLQVSTNGAVGSTIITLEADDGEATNTTSFVLTLHPRDFGQAFAPSQASNFEPVWGDFDGDGRMDVVTSPTTVLTNAGGGRWGHGWTLPFSGSVTGGVAADYDSDGWLDLLLWGPSGPPRLFRNQGATGGGLVGVMTGWRYGGARAAWADLDRDGDLDVVYGNQGLWWARNEGGGRWSELAIDLPLSRAPLLVAAGDYNQDGAPDLLVQVPSASTGVPGALLLRNQGGGRFEEMPMVLPSGAVRSGGFTDLNGDGVSDLWLVQGPAAGRVVDQLTVLIQEQGRFQETFHLLPAASSRGPLTVAWGDFDNDGDVDFVGPSWPEGTPANVVTNLTVLYRNDGRAHFLPEAHRIAPVSGTAGGPVADMDADGSLDMVLNRIGASAVFMTNAVATPNAIPSAPSGLQAVVSGATILLFWDESRDQNQSEPLTYNIRLGTAPGRGDLVSAMSSDGGVRRVPAPGNAGYRNWAALSLPWDSLDTESLYWSVQAVDHGLQGGPFAPEATFRIDPPGNEPPRIFGVADLELTEDTIAIVRLEVSDDRSPPEGLQVMARSSDPELVGGPGLALSGHRITNGVLRVDLQLKPATNRAGVASITVTAVDRQGAASERDFLVTVAARNDPPVLQAPAEVLGTVGTPLPGVELSATDVESPLASLRLSVVSLTPGLISDAGVRSVPTPEGWTLQVTPLADAVGEGRLALTVEDPDGGVDTHELRVVVQRQSFVPLASERGIPGLPFRMLAWGDLDGDRRMELVAASPFGAGSTVHQVVEGHLPVRMTLPGVVQDLGDVDNDGDVDVLLEVPADNGLPGAPRLQVFKNAGNWRFDPMPGTAFDGGVARFVDWDRDGRSDVLVAGAPARLILHRNTAAGFEPGRLVPLAGTVVPEPLLSLGFADLDGDGHGELLLTGGGDESGPRVFRRRGDGLEPVLNGAWTGRVPHGVADFNRDDRPDLLLADAGGQGKRLWLGEGGLSFEPGVSVGSREVRLLRVADFDADGCPDVLGWGLRFAGLWCGGRDGEFVPLEVPFGQDEVVQAEAADHDGDGRVDLALGRISTAPSGTLPEVLVLASESPMRQVPAAEPRGLKAQATEGGGMRLWWQAPSESGSTGGLTYNVRVGSAPGAVDVLSPMSRSDGWRLLPRRGNAEWRRFLEIVGLAPGRTYYWSVQAVDAGFTGGAFAPESHFTTPAALTLRVGEGGAVELTLHAAAGTRWMLESSEDLANWAQSSVGGELSPASDGLARLQMGAEGGRRFLRARLLE